MIAGGLRPFTTGASHNASGRLTRPAVRPGVIAAMTSMTVPRPGKTRSRGTWNCAGTPADLAASWSPGTRSALVPGLRHVQGRFPGPELEPRHRSGLVAGRKIPFSFVLAADNEV